MGITDAKRGRPLGPQVALDGCSFHLSSWSPQVGEYNYFLTLCSHLTHTFRYVVFNVKVLATHPN